MTVKQRIYADGFKEQALAKAFARSDAQRGEEESPRLARDDIPPQVSDAIERERRRLQKASAVLSCFHVAALYQDWHEEAIVASDVVLVVRNLVDDAISRLDLTALTRDAQEPTEGQVSTGDDSSPAD